MAVKATLTLAERSKGYTTYYFDVEGLPDYKRAAAEVDAAGRILYCAAYGFNDRRPYKTPPKWLKDAVERETAQGRRKKHPNWGGARENAGIAPKGAVAMPKTYYLRCTEELHAKLKAKSADWVREVLEKALTKESDAL